MSFSIDLWNGFDIIKSSFSLNHKRVKQLLEILTLYSNTEKEHYKSLDNLYKSLEYLYKEAKDSLLDDSLYFLVTSFKAESDKYKNYYNNITKNITEIKEQLDKIKLQISPYFAENMQNKDNFNKALNNLILKQEAYNKSCKDLCYSIAEKLAHKILEEKTNINKENKNNDVITKVEKIEEKGNYKDIINNKFKNYLNNNILKDINKKENLIKKIMDNKNEYIKCISETDKEREKYNKITEDILNNLQKHYKSLIFLFQNSIHNYIKEKNKTYNDIIEMNKIYDINQYSKIHYKSYTLSFITKYATKEFPMNKLEFLPYKINNNKMHQKFAKYNELTTEDQNKIINGVKNILNDSKINIYENEYLNQSFINQTMTQKYKKVQKLFKRRRSGSSQMFNLSKNAIMANYSTNNNNSDNKMNASINKILELKKNENNNTTPFNLNVKNIKDDIMLEKDNKKKANINFIKDFVFKLVISKDDIQNNTLLDIYSDNSSDEKDNDEDKDKNDKNKETYIYNELLFGFLDLIAISNKDHKEYLDYFIRILSVHRAKGYFLLNENTYKIFVNIFNYILINYKNSNNVIKNIILFSQTFYRNDTNNSNNKIYILNGLKNHTAFNNTETWHRAINYNLSLSIKNNNTYSLNIDNKEEYIKNLNKLASNTIISYLYDLKLSTTEKNVYEDVKNFYIKVYNLDGKIIEKQVKKLLGENNDDKNDKKEEKKKEKKEEEKEGKKEGKEKKEDKNVENEENKENKKEENKYAIKEEERDIKDEDKKEVEGEKENK